MTRKQAECLAFIAKYIEAYRQPPSMADIMVACGLKSKSGAARLVDALEERGFIRRLKYRARSIQIIDPGEVKLNDAVFKLVQQYAKAEEMSVDGAVNQIVPDALERAA